MFAFNLIYDLYWPKGIANITVLVISVLLSWLISFSWRFLVNLSAFWTPNARGILRLVFVLSWFFSGFLMPLRFFPDWIVRISFLLPFPHMFNTVIEIYLGILSGEEMIRALLGQFFWVIGLIFLGQIVLRIGVRRLVILGG